MLTHLRIENFAIIPKLELDFSCGLTAFTGETGAGKSIILDAIAALIGGKADATLLRSGADRALVEGEFAIPAALQPAIHDLLDAEELLDDPANLTLSREIRREGRSVARINGRSAALGMVRELGALLVDIHGQSEHLSLLTVRSHLPMLDRYAGNEDLLQSYQIAYRRLNETRRELHDLRQAEADAERRSDLLTFQLQEIEAAALREGEDEELRGERARLANAEGLAGYADQAIAGLDEGAPDAPALSDLAGQISSLMNALTRLDPSRESFSTQAEEIASLISDLSLELRGYRETIEFNPRRLEQVEERLELIRKLERKYGGSPAAVQAFADKAARELDTLTHAGERIAELEGDLVRFGEEAGRIAGDLSRKRKAAAGALERAVEGELAGLSMSGARFAVDFSVQPDPNGILWEDGGPVALGADGADRVEFLIAPNPGEGLKPLVRIASGGETSRLMLALKNVLVSADKVPTLIFDEIDQGIGGRVGGVVGEKLWQLGRNHSVLCVTHLPQLAAFADRHYEVHKLVEGGRTAAAVTRLGEQERVEELASMLGSLNEANRESAREALRQAQNRAAQLQRQAGG